MKQNITLIESSHVNCVKSFLGFFFSSEKKYECLPDENRKRNLNHRTRVSQPDIRLHMTSKRRTIRSQLLHNERTLANKQSIRIYRCQNTFFPFNAATSLSFALIKTGPSPLETEMATIENISLRGKY